MLRTESYTLERTRAFVAACFHDLADRPTQPFVSRADWPDLEIAEQRGLAGEHLSELEDEIATGNLTPQRKTWVTTLLRQHGIEPASLPDNVAHDLSLGMLRVQAEQDRLFMFRLGDRHAPYVPTDTLFIEQARTPASPVAPTSGAELLPTRSRCRLRSTAFLMGSTVPDVIEAFKRGDDLLVVGDDDDSGLVAGRHVIEDFVLRQRPFAIERRCRLIGEDDGRAAYQRPGDGDTLLFSP